MARSLPEEEEGVEVVSWKSSWVGKGKNVVFGDIVEKAGLCNVVCYSIKHFRSILTSAAYRLSCVIFILKKIFFIF